MGHRSGSARARRRRIAGLVAAHSEAERRCAAGGAIVGKAAAALAALRDLAGPEARLVQVEGRHLAALLDLIVADIDAGRAALRGGGAGRALAQGDIVAEVRDILFAARRGPPAA